MTATVGKDIRDSFFFLRFSLRNPVRMNIVFGYAGSAGVLSPDDASDATFALNSDENFLRSPDMRTSLRAV